MKLKFAVAVKQWAFAVVVLGPWCVGASWAQSITPAQADNSQLIKQEERDRLRREKLERRPDVRLATEGTKAQPTLPARETPCFQLSRFELQGARAQQFQWALAVAFTKEDPPAGAAGTEAAGRCLGEQGLNMVMARVQNEIIRRGFITTRVVAPPQDLRKGVFTMTLVPGTLSAIRLAPGSDERANPGPAIPIAPGNLLSLRELEQGLENLKRLPSVETDIQITAAQPLNGEKPQDGQSDLVVRWSQGRPWRLGLSVEDSGSKATGKLIGSANLSWDHPLGLNDQVSVNLNHDLGGSRSNGPSGTQGGSVSYSLPWGAWMISTSLGRSRYHQSVAGFEQSYLYSGTSDTFDLKGSRSIYRDAVRKLGAYGRLWTRSSKNFIDDTEIEVQRRRAAGWEAGLAHREFVGRAVLDAALSYRRGVGGLGSLPAPEEIFDEGTSRMKIVNADVQWMQPLQFGKKQLRYLGGVRAQWNQTRLVPQDRFTIGGRYSVRGFDGENLLTAERGLTLRNELAWQWHPKAEAYWAVDYGRVAGPSAAFLAGTHLSGTVVGVRGALQGPGQQQWSYDVFVGGPLSQPDGFGKRSTVAGFQLSWLY